MENQQPQEVKSNKGKALMVIALVLSVLGVLTSLIPFVGSAGLVVGLLSLVLAALAYRTRSKYNLKNVPSVIALVLSTAAITLGYTNYTNHKDAVDLILGKEGAKSKLLIVPDDSPIREVVERGAGHTEEEIEQRKEITEERQQEDQQEVNEDLKYYTNHQGARIAHGSNVKLEKLMSLPMESYYYCIVDNLRMRSAPTTDSEVLTKFRFGQKLRYLGEKSDQKEVINIGGKEQNDYWYKVQRQEGSGYEGWVYGGAMVNAAESSTHKLSGKTIKPFNFIKGDSLRSLIGRSGGYVYSGIMTFNEGEDDNNFDSNGLFFFDGISPQDYYEMPGYGDTEYLQGTMKSGSLNGKFKQTQSLFESSIKLNCTFKIGNCLTYEMEENQEGEISRCKGSDSKYCEFSAIKKKLKPVN